MANPTIDRLHALLDAGELRIITSEHACGGGLHPTIGDFDQGACEAFQFPMTDPRHFVIHQVTGLEQHPAQPEQWVAVTEEGDYCQGQPEALLARLTETMGLVL